MASSRSWKRRSCRSPGSIGAGAEQRDGEGQPVEQEHVQEIVRVVRLREIGGRRLEDDEPSIRADAPGDRVAVPRRARGRAADQDPLGGSRLVGRTGLSALPLWSGRTDESFVVPKMVGVPRFVAADAKTTNRAAALIQGWELEAFAPAGTGTSVVTVVVAPSTPSRTKTSFVAALVSPGATPEPPARKTT